MPLVSIVVPVYNAIATLPRCVESLWAVAGGRAEIIFVDGASTDGSVPYLRSQREGRDLISLISEPDRGIYDAMNKGWALARGQYVYFLGADDVLLDLPLDALGEMAAREIDLVAGRVLLDTGRVVAPRFGASLRWRNTLHHQGVFLRKQALGGAVPFDDRFQVFADYDLNLRLYRSGAVSFATVPNQIARFSTKGRSSSDRRSVRERYAIIRKHGGVGCVLLAFLNDKINGLSRRINA